MDTLISVLVWIISLSLTAVLFPVSVLVWFFTYPFDRERAVVHWWLVIQCILFSRAIPLWRLKVEGRRKAKPGKAYVIISNHQSILDILILNSLSYRYKWISKIENYRVPIIGWYLRMAKYITIDRGNKESRAEMIDTSARTLRKKISIMIFPEGTRSVDREIAPFKIGAFELALMTDKPVLPVIIDGTGGILPKHGLIFSSGHHIKIRVLDPVYPGLFGTANPEELAEKFRKIMISELVKMRAETF
jgi:1-acyl-sn-glycerol-3-phosphate acyltransferase